MHIFRITDICRWPTDMLVTTDTCDRRQLWPPTIVTNGQLWPTDNCDQRTIVTNGQLRTIADNCGQLRTIADNCGQLRTIADNCGQLRTIADNCGQLRTIADNCGQLRTIADNCGQLLCCRGAQLSENTIENKIIWASSGGGDFPYFWQGVLLKHITVQQGCATLGVMQDCTVIIIRNALIIGWPYGLIVT